MYTEEAGAIAADNGGNIYLTGVPDAVWNGSDGQAPLDTSGTICVLKLDSNGEYQWHAFLGGSNADKSEAVAADSAGNIYVTGFSDAT